MTRPRAPSSCSPPYLTPPPPPLQTRARVAFFIHTNANPESALLAVLRGDQLHTAGLQARGRRAGLHQGLRGGPRAALAGRRLREHGRHAGGDERGRGRRYGGHTRLGAGSGVYQSDAESMLHIMYARL